MENRKRSQRDGGPYIKQSPTKFKPSRSPSNRYRKMTSKPEDPEDNEWISDLIADVNNCGLDDWYLNSAPKGFLQADTVFETTKDAPEEYLHNSSEKPVPSTPLVDEWTFSDDFMSYQKALLDDFNDSLYDEWQISDDYGYGLYEKWVDLDICAEEDDHYEVDVRSDWIYESINYNFFEAGRKTAVYEEFFTDAAGFNLNIGNGIDFNAEFEIEFKNAFHLENTLDAEFPSLWHNDLELSDDFGFHFSQSMNEDLEDVASYFEHEIGSEWELEGGPIYDIFELESGFSDDGFQSYWEEDEEIFPIEV